MITFFAFYGGFFRFFAKKAWQKNLLWVFHARSTEHPSEARISNGGTPYIEPRRSRGISNRAQRGISSERSEHIDKNGIHRMPFFHFSP